MKTIFFIGFILFTSPLVYGQSITAGVGNIGASYKYYIDTTTGNAISGGSPGIGINYNIGSAIKHDSSVSNIVSPATITSIGASQLLGNKALITIRGSDTTVIIYSQGSVAGTTYINTVASKRAITLGAASFTVATVNSPPLKNYEYPIANGSSLNNVLTDSTREKIGFSVALLSSNPLVTSAVDSVRVTITTREGYVADGSGSLTTPQEIISSVLRLNKTRKQKIFIELKGKPAGFLLGIPLGWNAASNNVLALLNPNLKNDTTIFSYAYEYWTNGRYAPVVIIDYLPRIANTDSILQVQYQKSFQVNAINEKRENLKFNVYPNPTSDILKLSSESINTAVFNSVLVYTANGVLLQTIEIVKQQIDVSKLAQGKYILLATSKSNKVYKTEFVKL